MDRLQKKFEKSRAYIGGCIMQMTDEEIRRNYASAKNKKTQLGILADLNCCEKDEIKRIVEHVPKHEVKQDTVSHLQETQGSVRIIQEILFKKLDELDKQIKTLEVEYRNMLIAIEVIGNLEECICPKITE